MNSCMGGIKPIEYTLFPKDLVNPAVYPPYEMLGKKWVPPAKVDFSWYVEQQKKQAVAPPAGAPAGPGGPGGAPGAAPVVLEAPAPAPLEHLGEASAPGSAEISMHGGPAAAPAPGPSS